MSKAKYQDAYREMQKMISMSKLLCKQDVEKVGVIYDDYKKAIGILEKGIEQYNNYQAETNEEFFETKYNELSKIRTSAGIFEMLGNIKASPEIDNKLCNLLKTKKGRGTAFDSCYEQIKPTTTVDPKNVKCEDNAVSTDTTITNSTGGKKRRSKRRKNSKKRSRKSNRKSRRH